MRTSKFTDSQILAILKEYESGQTAKELSRKYGFHYQTLTFLHLSGCCSQVNFKIQLQNSNKWKQTFYEEKPL